MKILAFNWQDIKNPFGGGAEVHFHEIFERVAAQGHEIDFYCCGHPDLPSEENINGINVFRRGKRETFNYLVPKLYKNAVKKKGYDIVIDDINKIPFYTPLYVKEPILCISHHFFGKSIFRETNPIFGSYVYLAEKLMPVIYNNSHFAVVSESTKNDFQERGFNTSSYTIIENAIDQSSFPMSISKKNDEFTISYFGRLKKYKSVQHLITAFALLNKDFKDIRLEILGKGDYRGSLESLVKELKISDKVTFHGFVSDKMKIELLSSSHLMVNPSMKEGWGITNIEANACGTPVIAANVPGLKDSVSDGISGLLYEYGNIDALAAILKDLYLNPKKIEELSSGAIDWAKQFSWDISADKMITKMKQVINLNRKGI
ncbi:MAG: glycosyltransferase family 4 protein [Candidatus Kapaibacteriales bacterium]